MSAPLSTLERDDDQPSLLSEWLHAITHPGMLVHAGEELFNSFVSTRPWKRLLLFSPAILVLLGVFGLMIFGSTISREKLVMRYALLAEQELTRLKNETPAEKETDTPKLMTEEKTSAFSDMLYRRLLQLNDENARTRYLVAIQMARSQRLPQARQLMEEIAPLGKNKKGYEPAHAWMAVDLLSRPKLDNDEQARLLGHLEAAQNWEGMGSGLLAVYAKVLAAQNKRVEALETMSKAAKKDPALQSTFAIMARSFNQPKIADEMAVKARERLKEALARPDATEQQFVQLASLEITEENFQAALQVTREGLNRANKNSDQLKFLGSEALRFMYRKSIRRTPKGVEFNLGLLDAAMKEFPANPNLTTEIALLEEMGVEASAELKALMEQQLASGQATALAHLILANQEIKAGRMANAIPHLELTVKAAPNHPIALNNLALALAITDSQQVKRAEELIDHALTVDSRNPELYDSQGQIRLIAGRPLDAIASLEKAIGNNPNRLGSRELIIKAYREAGLEDMAKQQETALAQLRTEIDKKQSEELRSKNSAPAAATGTGGSQPTGTAAEQSSSNPEKSTDAPSADKRP